MLYRVVTGMLTHLIFSQLIILTGRFLNHSVVKMNPDLLPENWTWAFDPSAPTNRKNYKPFVKGENETTYLDYFVVSPNVEVLQTKTIDLNFENSDHNPVYLQVRLIK